MYTCRSSLCSGIQTNRVAFPPAISSPSLLHEAFYCISGVGRVEATDGNQPVSLSALCILRQQHSPCNFRRACVVENAFFAGVGACDLGCVLWPGQGERKLEEKRHESFRQRPRHASVGNCGSRAARVARECGGRRGREGGKGGGRKYFDVPSVFQIRYGGR